MAVLTDLMRFPPPSHWPPPNRIPLAETTAWTLDAILDSFKFENDPQSSRAGPWRIFMGRVHVL